MITKRERPRQVRRQLDGVLLLDKPQGLSSNAALQTVRRLFRAQKAGHTGTLDPLATGLLPICFGEATKFTHALLEADKRYRATLRLGLRTTTGDAEGEIVEQRAVAVNEDRLRQVLETFTGEILQLPPMYSALKHQGKPLYEYIRRGEVVTRAPRRVWIHELSLQRWDEDELVLDVRCSKGTYIRTLAEDIGEALGCGAHLSSLCRTEIGDFRLAQAWTLEALESMDEAQRDACLLPLDSLVYGLPKLMLDAVRAERLAKGQRLAIRDKFPDGRRSLYVNDAFIGVGELVAGRLSPCRLVSSIAQAAARKNST